MIEKKHSISPKDYKVPEYRVRLFLSVDLTGSTAFKHSQTNPLVWLKAFQKFYREFPKTLLDQYIELGKNSGLSDDEQGLGIPKLWKTVGDEILFCCKIYSIHHVSVCIEAFIQSLQLFGNNIQSSFNLDTKGNAWVASFPTPNSSIMPIIKGDFTDDPLSGDNDLVTEDVEQRADESPNQFDFLGKGIDSGFRISKNSSIDTLTISPGLAILLLDACQNKGLTKFKRKIRLAEMQCFKGVAGNSPYPVLVIDVIRNNDYKKIFQAQNNLLGMNHRQDDTELQAFLKDFLKFHNIECPVVKLYSNDSSFTLPNFYIEYKTAWEKEKIELEQKTKNEEQSIEDLQDEDFQCTEDCKSEEPDVDFINEIIEPSKQS